ncbi:MAG: hypothetical protein V4440_05420 [Pseudomonadota bacterium]
MQLNKFDTTKKANAGAFLHLVAPNGAKLYEQDADGKNDLAKPVGLYLLGLDSKAFQESKHKRANERRGEKVTSEMVDEESLQAGADLAVGWLNLEVDGDSEFSRANVLKIYQQYPWVREQVDNFVANRANFI